MLAADLVRRQVAVIVANAVSTQATSTIPIVVVTGIDPVRTGLVVSRDCTAGLSSAADTFAYCRHRRVVPGGDIHPSS
jgi:hypothetical protein